MEKEIQRFEKYNEMGHVMAFGGGLVRRNDWLCRREIWSKKTRNSKKTFKNNRSKHKTRTMMPLDWFEGPLKDRASSREPTGIWEPLIDLILFSPICLGPLEKKIKHRGNCCYENRSISQTLDAAITIHGLAFAD